MANKEGILIVFEGISTCGKSTQIDYLSTYLTSNGYEISTTSWNSDEVISPVIGQIKKHRLFTPFTWSILHATDFTRRYFEEIVPALEANKIVLADRYLPTAFTRDTIRGVPSIYVENLYSFARKPDIIFYLDLPPKYSLERRLKRHPNLYYYSSGNDINLHMDIRTSFIEYQKKLYLSYAMKKEDYNFCCIDGTQDPEKIFQDILLELDTYLFKNTK